MFQPNYSSAADRNKQAILDMLLQVLPYPGTRGNALEIASGTGQHAAWFASGLPGWTWQPSDTQSEGFESINAWGLQQAVHNMRVPVLLDVMASNWFPADTVFDLIYCANMLHIAPWPTCAALMLGSAQHLAPSGQLITYGPYFEDAIPTSPGNLAFDQSLRERNPAWGIRRLEDVKAQATTAGLKLIARHAMPANNLLLVWAQALW